MKSWVSAPPARWTQSGVKGFWSASTTVRTRLSVRSRAPSTYSRPRSSRAGRPSSRRRSRAAHGHQSLSGAEPAWRTSLVRHLESDLPQTHQTQPSHPFRDVVLNLPTGTPKRPQGAESLTVRPGAAEPFTKADVEAYFKARNIPKNAGSPDQFLVDSLEFITSKEVTQRLQGASTGLDDADRVGFATLSGTFIFTGPKGRPA